MFKRRLYAIATSVLLFLVSCVSDTANISTVEQPADILQFVFANGSGIWSANEDGTSITNIVRSGKLGYGLWMAGFSDDGARVAYWGGTKDALGLWISDIAAWNPRLISGEWPAGFVPSWVRWGENPRSVFVAGYADVEAGLFVVDLTTGRRDKWGWLGCPKIGVSPHTHRLAGWATNARANGDPIAKVIEMDGSRWEFSGELPPNVIDLENCVTHAFPALHMERDAWSWSPDRTQLAIMDYSGAPFSIAIISKRERERDDLVTDRFVVPNATSHLTWSPQGQHIAFESLCTNSSEACVFVLDVQSREIILETEGNGPLYWHPDGTKLFFNLDSFHYRKKPPRVGLWSMDLTTLEISRILTTPVHALTWRAVPTQN